MQRYCHVDSVTFSPMRCDFLKTSHFILSKIFSQVPLSNIFILLCGFHANLIYFCVFIPQPSFSFFFSLFRLFSFFFIRGVSISPQYHGFERVFLYFLTSAFPSYHTPQLRLLAYGCYSIISDLKRIVGDG